MTIQFFIEIFLPVFFVLMVGGVIGSGLTLLMVKRRRRLEAERELELRVQMANEVSDRIAGVLDQVMSRFESLEERLEFSERLMLERSSERDSEPTTGERTVDM